MRPRTRSIVNINRKNLKYASYQLCNILYQTYSLDIVAGLNEPLTSCLLAYIKNAACDNSSWATSFSSSPFTKESLSESVESTTKITN